MQATCKPFETSPGNWRSLAANCITTFIACISPGAPPAGSLNGSGRNLWHLEASHSAPSNNWAPFYPFA